MSDSDNPQEHFETCFQSFREQKNKLMRVIPIKCVVIHTQSSTLLMNNLVIQYYKQSQPTTSST